MLYYIKFQNSHKNALKDGCNSNGYPGVFKNIEDIRCYAQLLKGLRNSSTKHHSLVSTKNCILDDPYTARITNIWLGGLDVGCAGNYTWCARNLPMDINPNMWAENEPLRKGPNASCIVLSLKGPNPGLALADCADENPYVYKMFRPYGK
jgi:hypothetical protein